MDTEYELPSIEQCHAFMDAINAGRQAIGLEPIDKLEYDESEPGLPGNCLSAHHLFNAATETGAGGFVGSVTAGPIQERLVEPLAKALDAETETDEHFAEIQIPDTILAVTDPFDRSQHSPGLRAALRSRLVEAGLVEPRDA